MSTNDGATATERDTAGIDVEAVTAWLAQHTPLAGSMRFTRIGGGQSNLTYRVDDTAGTSAVLRRPPLGEVLQSAHDMGREFHVQSRLAAVGAPVPEQIAHCEDVSVTGAPFYVMAFVDGAILTTAGGAEALTPEARRTAGLSLAGTLAGLQAIDLDAAGLRDFRRPKPYCERQLRRWRGQWESSRTRDLPLVDELADRLTEAMPEEREAVLVHGDYRLDNVVLDGAGEVIAVLDWELCTSGHPLADVGLMLAYWQEASTSDGLFGESTTSVAGLPSPAEISEHYATSSGRSIDDLAFFTAFAYWKIAIILEGVYRRWLNDPANGAANAGSTGAAVERLARLADDAARAAGI